MTSPKVSIVIPTYNRANDLIRALNSVCAQTFSDWEAVVVDNHSTDNTEEVVKSYNDSRIKFFKVHNNGVIAVSRNLGIKESTGEYIAFLDSDDWWKVNKLEESVRYLSSGADIVYHELYLVKSNEQKYFFKKTSTRQVASPVFNDLLIHGNPISNSSVVVRKKFLIDVGGLAIEPDLIAIEDFDAWLKISEMTEHFKLIPKVLGYYWVGGGNVSTPARLLKNLDALRLRYNDKIQRLNIDKKVYWFNYAKGRAHFIQGAFDLAEKNLKELTWHSTPFFLYLKTCWMRNLIRWRLNERK